MYHVKFYVISQLDECVVIFFTKLIPKCTILLLFCPISPILATICDCNHLIDTINISFKAMSLHFKSLFLLSMTKKETKKHLMLLNKGIHRNSEPSFSFRYFAKFHEIW